MLASRGDWISIYYFLVALCGARAQLLPDLYPVALKIQRHFWLLRAGLILSKECSPRIVHAQFYLLWSQQRILESACLGEVAEDHGSVQLEAAAEVFLPLAVDPELAPFIWYLVRAYHALVQRQIEVL